MATPVSYFRTFGRGLRSWWKSPKRVLIFVLGLALVVFLFVNLCLYLHIINGSSNRHDEDRPVYEYVPPTSYVVNTPTCKIPNWDPWHKSTRFIKSKCNMEERGPRCSEDTKIRDWFYSNSSHLIGNLTAIQGDGQFWDGIRCWYHVIERVEQTLQKYDTDADNIVRLSSQCHKLPELANRIRHDFIRVRCMSTLSPFFETVVYRDLFAFARMDAHAVEKVSRWEGVPREERPPNVILLGMDSNSRLNSHRQLSKTLEILGEMGAVEMLGFTKVGMNTFPNTIGFFTGTSMEEMSSFCLTSLSSAQDGCPYIWKDFDRMGYLTAFAEDVPRIPIFNHMKTGFVRKPVDFYYRPFTLEVMRQADLRDIYVKCIGRRVADVIQLNYLGDILKLARGRAPVFMHSWVTNYVHECIHHARFLDELLAHFVRDNVEKATNTVLFFMSDHGDRYGQFRETTLGWYEDKLPSMWVYMSPDLRERFPGWNKALQINARRPTSHFDMYHTMIEILASFNKELTFNESYGNKTVPRRRGQSWLKPVPENRTCAEAGIPLSYCACTEPQILDGKSEDPQVRGRLKEVAYSVISFLREELPSQCVPPVLKEIRSAMYLPGGGGGDGGRNSSVGSGSGSYVVSFSTDPGNILIEATVQARKGLDGQERYTVESQDDVLRMNKMTSSARCMDNPVLEAVCYCYWFWYRI